MTKADDRLVEALLERHGTTYCDELSIPIGQGTPSPLFRWLVASILFSTRISADLAVKAARALADAGWTTADKLHDTTWEERVKVLNESGYARYDESTARMLGDTVEHLMDAYGGDLRRLREAADKGPAGERKLLKAFKGLGDVGVDIFMREAQAAWDELYPFADKKALSAAGKLGLPEDAEGLSRLVSRDDYPLLIAALVRTDLEKDYEALAKAAETA